MYNKYDLEQAKNDLVEAESALSSYLITTYKEKSDADVTLKYLKDIIQCICKSQAYKIEFVRGGSPEWNVNVLRHVANVVMAENNLGIIMSKLLEDQLP